MSDMKGQNHSKNSTTMNNNNESNKCAIDVTQLDIILNQIMSETREMKQVKYKKYKTDLQKTTFENFQ